GSSAPELDQAKGTDEADLADLCAEIEDSFERNEGVYMRVIAVLRTYKIYNKNTT
ncbi:hypothetical protein Tco_0671374, partial [Tanacetum coccineum]